MADSPILTGFDPDAFRTNITNTMIMGLPEDPTLQPTFYFRAVKTYPAGTLLDTEGSPLDPRIEATVTAPDPVQVPCAVEYTANSTDQETLIGTFKTGRAKLTLLDVAYELVKDAIEVSLGEVRYNITFQEPPIGLGPVTVYQLHVFPKNEDR